MRRVFHLLLILGLLASPVLAGGDYGYEAIPDIPPDPNTVRSGFATMSMVPIRKDGVPYVELKFKVYDTKTVTLTEREWHRFVRFIRIASDEYYMMRHDDQYTVGQIKGVSVATDKGRNLGYLNFDLRREPDSHAPLNQVRYPDLVKIRFENTTMYLDRTNRGTFEEVVRRVNWGLRNP